MFTQNWLSCTVKLHAILIIMDMDSQTGEADSSLTPGLDSYFQWFSNGNRGAFCECQNKKEILPAYCKS